MNFLQLCQRTARESGLASGAVPSSVVNQTGRALLIVEATATAYDLIQTSRRNWQWLRTEFSGPLTAVTPPAEARYAASSFGITRFSDWVRDDLTTSPLFYAMSIYVTATGVADETILSEIPWPIWRLRYGRGQITANRPTEWAVDPQMNLCIGVPPNVPITLRGEYRKGNQTLAANTDTPEMPERFHMAIPYRAVQLLGEIDEADPNYLARAENKFNEINLQLQRDQMTPLIMGGNPIA